jgi:RNA polymerase sigma factor (sigma-70 family)
MDETEIDQARLRRIERAIERLPRMQREIFIAVRFHDLGYGEIARQTGLSERQIERYLARAVCNLFCALHGRRRRHWWQLW